MHAGRSCLLRRACARGGRPRATDVARARRRVIYTLRHRTTYRYGKPVHFARCTLRLKPQDGEGQSVLASAVTIDPSPTRR